MQVYALYHCYYDYCDFWENLINLYAVREVADEDQIKLSSGDHDSETDSWYVRELDVI